MRFEHLVGQCVERVRVGRQVDDGFGTAVTMPPVVIENALAQRRVRRFLVACTDRRVDADTLGVRVIAIGVKHHLSCHLGDEFGMRRGVVRRGAHAELLDHRLLELLVGDRLGLQHPAQHVLLPLPGACGIHDRIVGRRRLRQPSQHCRLGRGQLLEGLAEVDPRGGRKPICPLPKVDLVDVELEDLVLRKICLDLVGEQHLVELPGVRLLARQEELARHLHRDRPAALLVAGQGRQRRADHRNIVDAAMTVETLVFRRKNCRLDQIGDLFDFYNRTPLYAEFAEEIAFFAINAQRNLRLIIGNCR